MRLASSHCRLSLWTARLLLEMSAPLFRLNYRQCGSKTKRENEEEQTVLRVMVFESCMRPKTTCLPTLPTFQRMFQKMRNGLFQSPLPWHKEQRATKKLCPYEAMRSADDELRVFLRSAVGVQLAVERQTKRFHSNANEIARPTCEMQYLMIR